MDLTVILGGIATFFGAVIFWLARRGGQRDAQLDEAARKAARDEEQARRIDNAIAQRRDADEIARTTPADAIGNHPSMRDRQRD